MSYFILERLLYHLTHALDFWWLDSQFNYKASISVIFHNTIWHMNIIIWFYLAILSIPSGFVALKDWWIIFYFFYFAYSIKVNPETCRALWIRYLYVYWKHTTILYVVDIILSYNFTIRYFIYTFSKICSRETFVYHNPFDYFF